MKGKIAKKIPFMSIVYVLYKIARILCSFYSIHKQLIFYIDLRNKLYVYYVEHLYRCSFI